MSFKHVLNILQAKQQTVELIEYDDTTAIASSGGPTAAALATATTLTLS
jgi:hypothetical protein